MNGELARLAVGHVETFIDVLADIFGGSGLRFVAFPPLCRIGTARWGRLYKAASPVPALLI